jgi:kynurenine formamidase
LLAWIADSGIAAIVADNVAVEFFPPKPGEAGTPFLPLHELCLFKLGINLGEMWYLTELADWLRDNDRTRFFLTAPPLRLRGHVGSPVTPIATV